MRIERNNRIFEDKEKLRNNYFKYIQINTLLTGIAGIMITWKRFIPLTILWIINTFIAYNIIKYEKEQEKNDDNKQ